jgi:hypothetical protein
MSARIFTTPSSNYIGEEHAEIERKDGYTTRKGRTSSILPCLADMFAKSAKHFYLDIRA